MIKTRIRKVLRDVRARLGRTVLTSFAIFLGVAGTIALRSMSLVITEQLNEDIKEDELAMLDVALQTTGEDELDDEAYLEAVREEFGEDLTDFFAVASFFTQFTTEADSDEFEDGGVFAFSQPLDEPLPLEPFRLVEGDYPAEGQSELLVERRLADEYELGVGDSIYLKILSPSRDPELDGAVGTVEAWTVSGIVFHPYMGASNGLQFTPEQALYANLDDVHYIGGINGFSGYRARFTSFELAEDLEKDFTAFVANSTPYSVPFSGTADPEQNQLIAGAQTFTQTMSFLAILALVVSGFLVVNVIGSIVGEQRQQIGIMKTLGASGTDNFLMFSGIAFAYGVIAVIFGLPVGVLLGSLLSHVIAPELSTLVEGFKWHPVGIAIGVALGLVIPVMAAIIPVITGVRVRILTAISDVGITSRYGTGPVAKIIGAFPLPATIRQGLSNVVMKPFRTMFTVLTLAVAVGAFVGIFGVLSAIEDGFGSFLDIFNVEFGIAPTTLGRSAEVIEIMNSDPNIVRAEPAVFTLVNFVDFEPAAQVGGPPGILAYGFDVTSEDPAMKFTIDEGENLNADNASYGVVMSSNLASGLDADIGDTVTLDLPAGTSDITIVGIIEYPIDIMFADWQLLSKAAGFTAGGVVPNQYFTTVNVEGLEEPVASFGATNEFTGFLTFIEGETFSEDATVIVSQALAEVLGVSVGDTLNLTALTDDGTSGEYTINGIVDTSAIPQGGGAEQIPENLIAMDFRNLAALEGISLDGEPLPQAYFAKTTLTDATVDEVDDVMNALEERFLERGIAVGGFNFVEFQEQFTEAIRTIQFILQAVVLLIAAIGALGLLTTLSMSVFERQKEIGVMRSIGAGSSAVALQFLTEGIVVGFISWLVGLPLAALIQLLLLEVADLRETFGFQFDIYGALLALVGVMIITTIASLWPSLSAARRTVSDILRYQ